MKRVMMAVAGAAAALLMTLGFSTAAGAQEYTGATLVVPITVSPGENMTVSGTGFLPNAPVTVTVASTPTVVGTPMTDGDGNWTLTFAAPTEPGVHTITASDGTNVITGTFTVVAAGTAVTPAGTLPYTGSDSSLPLAQLGLGLVAVGAIAVLMVRKRNARTTIDA